MKLRLCCLALALAVCAVPAFADISVPQPAPSPQKARRTATLPAARMLIESRNDATEARLQIPKNMLRQLRAEAERDDATSNASTAALVDSSRPAQTIKSIITASQLMFTHLPATTGPSPRRPPRTRATLYVRSGGHLRGGGRR